MRTAVATEGVVTTDSSWGDWGQSLVFAAISSTSTATIDPIQVITAGTSTAAYLAPGAPIQRLQGASLAITGATAQAAASTQVFGIVVYHQFATLATQVTNAGGAITSLSTTALNAPMPSGGTFTMVNAAGTVQTWTTSAVVPKGATTIPVTSTTPTGTNAVGNALVGTLGGAGALGIQFGWLAATGTPALYLNQTTLLPAVSANITAGGGNTAGDPYGPYTYLYPGDIPCLYVASAGSLTFQSGIITLLIA